MIFFFFLGVKFEINEMEGGYFFLRVFMIKNEIGKYFIKIFYFYVKEGGVNFIKGEVEELVVKYGKVYGVFVNGEFLKFDVMIIVFGGFIGFFKYIVGLLMNFGMFIGDVVMKGVFVRDFEFI